MATVTFRTPAGSVEECKVEEELDLIDVLVYQVKKGWFGYSYMKQLLGYYTDGVTKVEKDGVVIYQKT
jgi:hypothetical protein